MNSKYLLLTILTTLCIVGLHQSTISGQADYPEYHVSPGQVADFELKAPFDFPLLKPLEQLEQERAQALSALPRPYKQNGEAVFEAQQKLDGLFDLLYKAAEDGNLRSLRDSAVKSGYQIDENSLRLATDPARLEPAHNAIKAALSEIYRIGVYGAAEGDDILLVTGNATQKQNKTRFFQLEQAKRKTVGGLRDPLAAGLLEDNAALLIKPNLVTDQEKLAELTKQAVDGVSLSSGEILRDEMIIRKNDRINETDLNKLRSLTEEYKNREIKKTPWQQLLSFMGLLMYAFAIVFAFNFHHSHTYAPDKKGTASPLTLDLGLLVLVALAAAMNIWLGLDNVLIPFAMVVIAAGILIGYEFGIIYTLCGILLICPFINWDIYAAVQISLSALLTLLLMRNHKSSHEYFRVWMYMFASLAFTGIAIALFKGSGLSAMLRNTGFALASSIVSVIGCAAIVAYYEKRWNRATKQVLLELLDFNHPLLKKLATSAVGTYHHSLIVGNLAERAAEAIGANPLLARVGSYYHDIGKLVHPDIFTENNEDSSQIHAQYQPGESANLIRDHVKEGTILAAKYKIPQPVVDILVQHHGRSSIRYFLNQAQQSGQEVDPTQFSYPGPLPQSKEAVLVMLADIVESTTKAKVIGGEEDIVKIIDDTVQRLIREGQIDEAPITLKEIRLAREAMVPVLESIYRKRLDYPEAKTD